MAIVIGAGTTVTFGGACAISAQWGYNPNAQRFYCIGSWEPEEEFTLYKPTESLNLTIYASTGPTGHSTAASIKCENAETLSASVSPASCDSSVRGIGGEWFVQSYNYTKDDAASPGQESWSMTRWVQGPDGGPLPTVLRGIAEGHTSNTSTGVQLKGPTVESSSGSVSAGGFGRADEITAGVVASVGGGVAVGNNTGTGSASIPYTPLYLGTD